MAEPLIPIASRIGLARSEAAEYVGMSAPTFDRLVAAGTMPKPKRVFTRLIWDRREIDAAFARIDTGEVERAEQDEYAV